MKIKPDFEGNYNVVLADILRREGLNAEPEVKFPGGLRVDVLADFESGVRVGIEGEIANRRGAMADAKKRLAEGLVDAAIAVSYPQLKRARELRFLLDDEGRGQLVSARAGLGLWVAGADGSYWRRMDDGRSFAKYVEKVADEIGDVEVIAKDLERRLLIAAERLPGTKTPMLDALMVATAAMFHGRLEVALADKDNPAIDAFTGKPFKGIWPPEKLRKCLNSDDVTDALLDAWKKILAWDFQPVFRPVVALLEGLRSDGNSEWFVKLAAKAGQEALVALRGLRQDLIGRVFHKVLATAAPTGAFYTRPVSATFLTRLAIRPEHAKYFNTLTIIDLACGTGTLLVEGGRRLAQLTPDADCPVGSQHMIEKTLRGYDISDTAIHFAGVSLGMLNPEVPYEEMRIKALPFGETIEEGKKVYKAGSLEFYNQGVEQHDIVIGNPPYTRDSLRGDHFEKEGEEQGVKDRTAEIFSDVKVSLSNSIGPFLLLAEQYADKKTGTMAKVLPTSAFSRTREAQQVWKLLVPEWHLEYVVASHDPSRFAFSETTGVSEMLIVMRRRNDSNWNEPTFFVNLVDNPDKSSTAEAMADAIVNKEMKGMEWPRSRVEALDWTPVKFLNRSLTRRVTDWFVDGEGFVPLSRVADVGPAGRQTHDAYRRAPLSQPDKYGRVGIWYNNQHSKARNGAPPKWSMSVKPDCSLVRKENVPGGRDIESLADKYWERRGHLFLSLKFRPRSARTFAVKTTERALGAEWVPARHLGGFDAGDWEKAMCVYLNSTVGVLAQIWASSPKVFGRPDMKMAGLRDIPVPDFTADQTAWLERVFEKFSDRELGRFRDAGDDPVRKDLDVAVCEVLGWDTEEVETARSALCREPSVTGRPAE